jgi:hypothetical protein
VSVRSSQPSTKGLPVSMPIFATCDDRVGRPLLAKDLEGATWATRVGAPRGEDVDADGTACVRA